MKTTTKLLGLGIIIFFACNKKDNLTNTTKQYPVYDYDHNGYDTVNIHGQTWLVQNLRTTHYRNGQSIINIPDSTQWANAKIGAWCYYNNDSNNGKIYGLLYNRHAVDSAAGLAPQGWHIPSTEEVDTLGAHLGILGLSHIYLGAGDSLKSTTLWSAPYTNATNSSGFTALPGGRRDDVGGTNFNTLGTGAYFWTTGFDGADRFVCYYLLSNSSKLTFASGIDLSAYSVRCIKNK